MVPLGWPQRRLDVCPPRLRHRQGGATTARHGETLRMKGIHHVTAIAGQAARNLQFYTRTLGLRLVKKTVNFDDPSTYHFYFGDESGRPGTILTFFPWEYAAPGRDGVGMAHTTLFRVPQTALAAWTERFRMQGVQHEAPSVCFGEPVLPFTDPDGMNLALVGVAGAEQEAAWAGGPMPAEQAIRGFHGVSLWLRAGAATGSVLTGVLGFKEVARENAHVRYRANDGMGGIVDIREAPALSDGRMGRGSVHHIAFRARDDREQAEMGRRLLAEHGLQPTGQKDRQYFRSIYFREPGGVLFEIATDEPGFAIDEPLAELGKSLKLPPFLESRRRELQEVLPSLDPAA
jgi:glyoxalase family protein